MALKFGEIPKERANNTIILAAGTINGISGCDTDGYSFIRRVSRLEDVRDGESVFIVNKDKDISIIAGEYKKDQLVINEQVNFLVNIDLKNPSNNIQGIYNKILDYAPEKYFEEDEADFRDSVCIFNIDGDTNNIEFTKNKRKSPSKAVNDMLKPGINIVMTHQPSMEFLDFEIFMFEIINVVDKGGRLERYVMYSSLANGANREDIGKDSIFRINNNGLQDESNIFAGLTVGSFYNSNNNIEIGAITERYIQSASAENGRALIVQKDEEYEGEYNYCINLFDAEVDVNNKLNLHICKRIDVGDCKDSGKEIVQNSNEIKEIVKKYYRGEYYCIDLSNMQNMRFQGLKNPSRDKEYILLGFEDQKLVARLFEAKRNSEQLHQIGVFEILTSDRLQKEISPNGIEFLNLPNKLLDRDKNFDREF